MKNELALLKAARRLDQDALTAIFDMYAPILYKYVLRMCHDPIQSDRIVGEVFAKLLEQLAHGQGPLTSLKAYIFKIAYHCIVDGEPYNHRFAPLEKSIGTTDKSKKKSVHVQSDERGLLESFRFILNNELREIERHVIILRFMEGFSLRETADIVDKKVNHVKVLQNRGVAKLRASLENRGRTIGVPNKLITTRNGD